MDRAYIDSILKVILYSNMTDINIKSVDLRLITCSIEDGREVYTIEMYYSDTIFSSRVKLSQAWIACNLLLFTIFDGYLEDKYALTEGDSFKNHYSQLPSSDDIELIQRDCYRIMKLLRNAAQHNLSSIQYSNGNYVISYVYRNTNYNLKISKQGIDCLYTIMIDIIQESIAGLSKNLHTRGHFNGIIKKLYEEMCSEIDYMNDDIGIRTPEILTDPLKLQYAVRYAVKNPIIINESTKITLKHIANKAGVDKNGKTIYYPTDYTYKNYVLPQEIGKITSQNSNGHPCKYIEFPNSVLCDLWKVRTC